MLVATRRAILEEAPVRERLLAMGYMGAGMSIDDFDKFLHEDDLIHRRLIQELKIKAD